MTPERRDRLPVLVTGSVTALEFRLEPGGVKMNGTSVGPVGGERPGEPSTLVAATVLVPKPPKG